MVEKKCSTNLSGPLSLYFHILLLLFCTNLMMMVMMVMMVLMAMMVMMAVVLVVLVFNY